jgi:hypothetical protein
MLEKYRIRFDELENEMEKVKNTKVPFVNSTSYTMEYDVDKELFIEWRIKVKNLIANACGQESVHYKAFVEPEYGIGTYKYTFERLRSIFRAAKDDYLNGYLDNVKTLVQAEVFSDELEQAKELLTKNYHDAAAVITRIVLETYIRELCKKNNIAVGSLNKMNDDLAKAGVYNSLIQKQITALAGIGNSAAHGKKDEYTIDQVKNMISTTETLLAFNL